MWQAKRKIFASIVPVSHALFLQLHSTEKKRFVYIIYISECSQAHPCWWLSASRKPVAIRTHSPMWLYCCCTNVWFSKGYWSIIQAFPPSTQTNHGTRHPDLRAFRRHWSRWQRRQCRALDSAGTIKWWYRLWAITNTGVRIIKIIPTWKDCTCFATFRNKRCFCWLFQVTFHLIWFFLTPLLHLLRIFSSRHNFVHLDSQNLHHVYVLFPSYSIFSSLRSCLSVLVLGS